MKKLALLLLTAGVFATAHASCFGPTIVVAPTYRYGGNCAPRPAYPCSVFAPPSFGGAVYRTAEHGHESHARYRVPVHSGARYYDQSWETSQSRKYGPRFYPQDRGNRRAFVVPTISDARSAEQLQAIYGDHAGSFGR